MRRRSLLPLLAVALLAAFAHRAYGVEPTFVVSTTADDFDDDADDGLCKTASGACTLRAAIDQSFLSNGATVILPAGTYTLTHGEMQIYRNITLRGAGASKTEIVADVASADRIFVVYDFPLVFRLEDLTLRDAATYAAFGAAMSAVAPAAIVMERCRITNCKAESGGAIVTNGSLKLVDTVISDCRATKGAIPSAGHGGAIYLFGNEGGNARAQLDRCTLNGNVAVATGGAVFLGPGYGSLSMTNSTVSLNQAGSYGGAVRVEGSALELTQVTMTGNTSDTYAGGGGISNTGAASAVMISGSIISDNYDSNGRLLVPGQCAGSVSSYACNVFGTGGTDHCAITGTYTSALPVFGPLKDNGGYTPTHALLEGSPGVDFGLCPGEDALPNDQRGASRRWVRDLGAYERMPCGDVNGDGWVDVGDALFLINFLFANGPAPPGLADMNQDGERNVSDALRLIDHLFADGPAPVCPGT